jgi:hypothetical protein
MGEFSAFMRPAAGATAESVVVSERFLGEDGKPAPFTIHGILQEENDALIKASTRTLKGKSGRAAEKLDTALYQKRLVAACVSDPDFASAKMCESYGAVDPLDVPGKMLLAGEFAKLLDAIMRANAFDDPQALAEEAKNS